MTNVTFPQCLLITSSAIRSITITGDDAMIITFKGGAEYKYQINYDFLSEVILGESVGKTFNSFKPILKLI